MRSFIITLALFLSVCVVIFFNYNYINRVSAFVIDCVSDEAFNTNPKAAIEKLEHFWRDNSAVVGLSVGYKELDRMSDLIIDLRTYFELGNTAEVTRIRALIVETADEISRLERFDIENLL